MINNIISSEYLATTTGDTFRITLNDRELGVIRLHDTEGHVFEASCKISTYSLSQIAIEMERIEDEEMEVGLLIL